MEGQLMLRDVAQIVESSCAQPDSPERFAEKIELPLREACLRLFDKGLKTLSSSANREGIRRDGEVWILLDYESLSDENKAVARKTGVLYEDGHNNGGQMVVRLCRKVDWETTVEYVEEWALRMADAFNEQPMIWVRTWTREQLCRLFGIDPNDETHDVYAFCAMGHGYDPETRLFYESLERMRQVKRLAAPFLFRRREA